MRKVYREAPILTSDEPPGKGLRGYARYKGQLFLDHTSGDLYQATEAGRTAKYVRLTFSGSGGPNPLDDPEFINDVVAAITADNVFATFAQGAKADAAVPNTTAGRNALLASTEVSQALAAKASTQALTDGLSAKADASAVTTALATKASTTDLTTGLSGKVDKLANAKSNTVGWVQGVWIAAGATVPAGLPAYTLVIEADS